MAGTVNKVILIGRLGADPEIRYTPSGMAVANFNIATDDRVRGADGNWTEQTEWHRIAAFDRLAENCGNYLSKGRLVYVEGRIRTNQWEDQQGNRRFSTQIVARDVRFLSSPSSERTPQTQSDQAGMGGRQAPPASYGQQEQPFSEELPPSGDQTEDDIPF
jgi:single-strand DNA-binding protein